MITGTLQSIGSDKILKTTKEALEIYGKTPSMQQEKRMSEIALLTNDCKENLWDSCDSNLYEIEDEDMGRLLMDHAELNKKKLSSNKN